MLLVTTSNMEIQTNAVVVKQDQKDTSDLSENKQEKDTKNRTRYFKLIYNKKQIGEQNEKDRMEQITKMFPSDEKYLKQAANKAFTKLIEEAKETKQKQKDSK